MTHFWWRQAAFLVLSAYLFLQQGPMVRNYFLPTSEEADAADLMCSGVTKNTEVSSLAGLSATDSAPIQSPPNIKKARAVETPETTTVPTAEPGIPGPPPEFPTPQPTLNPASGLVDTLAEDINTAVNIYRVEHKKTTLNNKSELCEMAEVRVGELKYGFDHSGFEWRMSEGVFSHMGLNAYAENIWQGDGTVTTTLKSWDASQGHKENLLGEWSYGCGEWREGRAVYLFGR